VAGSRRVSPKNRGKALICALGWGALTALWTAPARALGAHVENRCPKLSPAEYEELDARVLLLLKGEGSEGGTDPLPAVVCGEGGSWVAWHHQRFAILGRAPIADEVVDIIEVELHGAERNFAADPKTSENAAVAAGEPMLQAGAGTAPAPPAIGRPADPVAKRAVDARGGGISTSIETEIPSDTISTATGPAFDFGSSVGPVSLGGREAFRFTFSGRRVAFMDFEGAIATGAPLNPDARFGAVLRFGAEWMVAYPEGNSGQADVVPVIDFGVRVAHSFGLVGIWGGIDARLRMQTLSLRSSSSLIANDVGASFSVGVAFVDWSRK
jgi:hypothetical protein